MTIRNWSWLLLCVLVKARTTVYCPLSASDAVARFNIYCTTADPCQNVDIYCPASSNTNLLWLDCSGANSCENVTVYTGVSSRIRCRGRTDACNDLSVYCGDIENESEQSEGSSQYRDPISCKFTHFDARVTQNTFFGCYGNVGECTSVAMVDNSYSDSTLLCQTTNGTPCSMQCLTANSCLNNSIECLTSDPSLCQCSPTSNCNGVSIVGEASTTSAPQTTVEASTTVEATTTTVETTTAIEVSTTKETSETTSTSIDTTAGSIETTILVNPTTQIPDTTSAESTTEIPTTTNTAVETTSTTIATETTSPITTIPDTTEPSTPVTTTTVSTTTSTPETTTAPMTTTSIEETTPIATTTTKPVTTTTTSTTATATTKPVTTTTTSTTATTTETTSVSQLETSSSPIFDTSQAGLLQASKKSGVWKIVVIIVLSIIAGALAAFAIGFAVRQWKKQTPANGQSDDPESLDGQYVYAPPGKLISNDEELLVNGTAINVSANNGEISHQRNNSLNPSVLLTPSELTSVEGN